MPSSALIATIVFWALMLPIAALIFQNVCNMCGADAPAFRRSFLITICVAAAAFITFDGLSYGIAKAASDDLNLNLAPGYGYFDWLREPIALKWQVLGLIPVVRWLPVLVAVCLAATLYVLILTEPFRICVAIMAIQTTVTVVAWMVLSFAMANILGFMGVSTTPAPPEMAQGTGPAPGSPEERAAARPKARRGQPKVRRETVERKTEEEGGPESAHTNLQSALAAHEESEGSSEGKLHDLLHKLDEHLEPYTEPIRDAAEPYTEHLPPAVKAFLDDGGWSLVLLALAVVALFWLRALFRRVKRILFPRRRHGKRRERGKGSPLAIDLDLVADAFTDPGAHQITVRGQSGRLRLVILAPSPSYVGQLSPEMAESLLEWLQPGLGEVLDSDKPRLVAWPRHPSLDRFVQMFHKLVQIPEVKGRRTPWVLVSGSARLGRQIVFLGLVVFLDKTGYQREIQVSREKWNEVLGLQEVSEPV